MEATLFPFAGVWLQSVEIPDSVHSIGARTFSFSGLVGVINIPASVTTIGLNAFKKVSRLTSINVSPLNDAYESINGVLFTKGAEALICYPSGRKGESLAIPASVTSIESGAFFSCKLSNFTVDVNNQYFASKDGVLFNKDITLLIKYPEGRTDSTYDIPDSVITIGEGAFYQCSSLESVVIPEGVESIEGEAFYACSKLTSLNLPSTICKISLAAYDCPLLMSITVNETNPVFKSIDGVLFNKETKAIVQYPSGRKSTHNSIPNEVKEIGMCAFRGSQFVSVDIPESVTLIGYSAFFGSKVNSVTIPKSVKSIEYRAFVSCDSLTSIIILGCIDNISTYAFQGINSLKSITYLGTEEMTALSMSEVTKLEKVCVTPYYEGDTFGGFSNLTKSLKCEIDAVGTATIHSPDVFMELSDIMKNKDYPSNLTINITDDIDFDGINFIKPLGTTDDDECNVYSGTLNGNGHSIKNIKMTNANSSSSSMFCEIRNGKIMNMIIEETCEFEGDISSSVSLVASGNTTIENVINKAKTNGIERACGFVNNISNSTESILIMKNCVNEGNVISINNGTSCGFVCKDGNGIIRLYNCKNGGYIEGRESYGMSNEIEEAHNVISVGIVNGTDEKYSFWKLSSKNTTSIYGIREICENCEEDEAIILSEVDNNGIIKTIDNRKRVDLLMNEASEAGGYGMYWSRDFSLSPKHVVMIEQEKDVISIEVEHGMTLKDIYELKHFFP